MKNTPQPRQEKVVKHDPNFNNLEIPGRAQSLFLALGALVLPGVNF